MNVEEHIGLARSIASQYYRNHSNHLLEYEDVEQEAYYRLIKACEGYDSSNGATFSSYATKVITQGLNRLYVNNESSVSYGSNARFDRLFKKVTFDCDKWTVNSIMEKYKTNRYNAMSVIQKYRSKNTLRLDKCLENSTDTYIDMLDLGGYKRPDLMYERKDLLEYLYHNLRLMPIDWKYMIDRRYFKNMTLQKIADIEGVSPQAVKGKLERVINTLKMKMEE